MVKKDIKEFSKAEINKLEIAGKNLLAICLISR